MGRRRRRRRRLTFHGGWSPGAKCTVLGRRSAPPEGQGGTSRFPDAPGGIRTHDLRLRRPTLYPAELLARTRGRFSRFWRSVEVGGGLGQPPLTSTNLDRPPPTAFFSRGERI